MTPRMMPKTSPIESSGGEEVWSVVLSGGVGEERSGGGEGEEPKGAREGGGVEGAIELEGDTWADGEGGGDPSQASVSFHSPTQANPPR